MVGIALATTYFCGVFSDIYAMDIFDLKGRWVLEEINGEEIIAGKREIYFQIAGQSIIGFDGCNRFGGNVISAYINKSQRACPPETVMLPIDPVDLISQLGHASIEGDKLYLSLPNSKGSIRFRRVDQ